MKKLVLFVSLIAVLAVVGCGGASSPGSASEGPGTIVNQAKDNASIVTCRTNRAQIDQQYAFAQSAGTDADYQATVEQVAAKCPSGGTYSWDATTGKTRCSVHGE
jgi:hypothetical protein